ncbi:Endo-1,4-beta-xylanase A precursor [Enhygromyxa salina]|uniref:Endo-1,4-beta-xylanase A n=1 Tax=Enhygromyxa salina TaxID=215803 RepID=A0A0C2D8G1_9BACT|nr:Endo-1,4-beta-xylanase A precursor [Enhygromyxa salina]
MAIGLTPAMFACGDSGGSEANDDGDSGTDTTGDTGSEASEAMGDGDGDPGDGDGDTGDGDGDGDGDTGDGDGDTGDGDGDGDTGDGDGDGDGDMSCEPAGDTPCAECTAENCCDELQACAADETCSCFSGCLGMGMNGMECSMECGVDNPMQIPALGQLRICTNQSCMMECPGAGGMP